VGGKELEETDNILFCSNIFLKFIVFLYYFQQQENNIKKQYREAIRTQTSQYKFLQKQTLERAPRDQHKDIIKQYREDRMRKMADLAVQYDQSIAEMLQRQTVRLLSLVYKVKPVESNQPLISDQPHVSDQPLVSDQPVLFTVYNI
jgi:hypothetical protein